MSLTYKGWVVGKRIPVGIAVGGVATALIAFFPLHAAAITGLATTVTALLQVYIANKHGVTQKPS